jgi:DNA-directed RNA polymerase omega subunit
MEEISSKIDSKFRFVLLSAQRAEQMMRGARAKVDERGRKPTRVAMEEVTTDAVEWDYGPAPEVEGDAEGEEEEQEAEAGVN